MGFALQSLIHVRFLNYFVIISLFLSSWSCCLCSTRDDNRNDSSSSTDSGFGVRSRSSSGSSGSRGEESSKSGSSGTITTRYIMHFPYHSICCSTLVENALWYYIILSSPLLVGWYIFFTKKDSIFKDKSLFSSLIFSDLSNIGGYVFRYLLFLQPHECDDRVLNQIRFVCYILVAEFIKIWWFKCRHMQKCSPGLKCLNGMMCWESCNVHIYKVLYWKCEMQI